MSEAPVAVARGRGRRGRTEKPVLKGEERLQAVLAEYRALRNEIVDRDRHQLQLYSFLIAALGVGVAYVVQQKAYDLLLAIPLLTTALGFRHLWEQTVIVTIGGYIRDEIEAKRIPELLGHRQGTETADYDPYWVAWEHYFRARCPPHAYYKLAIQILYVLLPFGGALGYLAVLLFDPDMFGVTIKTNLPSELCLVTAAVYSPLSLVLCWKLWTS